MRHSTNRKHFERGPVEYWGAAERWPNVSFDWSVYGTTGQDRLTVGPGEIRDSLNTNWMRWDSTLTLDMSVTGPNGLDAGTKAADTWYYLYLIQNPKTKTTAAILSTVNEFFSGTLTLPPGYSLKRQTKLAVRTYDDAGTVLLFPFTITEGWPHHPKVLFSDMEMLDTSGNLYRILTRSTAVSFADLPVPLMPPISRLGVFSSHVVSSGSTTVKIRAKGSQNNGLTLESTGIAGDKWANNIICATDENQIMQVECNPLNGSLGLFAQGYIVTEV
jgi:hypothetical protein